ncbi:hypothetical protein [Tuwongella immobilis]|uniref:Uncharacterized protein n=1 Tax=Tuwongella immobilis TaxID=692036 RepID=A0A6C2YRK8_9BACT|nr:hypothetical protein [Tuwongella immobilis]VIP03512.1 unnamed protein product [Tuwongella immobilis]VTS04392.1 unnamed protein product [Tuwongella immobilis]
MTNLSMEPDWCQRFAWAEVQRRELFSRLELRADCPWELLREWTESLESAVAALTGSEAVECSVESWETTPLNGYRLRLDDAHATILVQLKGVNPDALDSDQLARIVELETRYLHEVHHAC